MMKWMWKILYHWNMHKAVSLEVEKFKYESFSKQLDIAIKKRLQVASNYLKRY